MYKKIDFQTLSTHKSNFFQNLKTLLYYEKAPTIKDLLKKFFSEGDDIYIFSKGSPRRHFAQKGENVYITDETERLQLTCSQSDLLALHAFMKNDKNVAKHAKESKSTTKMLQDRYVEGFFSQFLGKPYLVYDIETSYATSDLRNMTFYLGYAYIVDASGKGSYRYIAQNDLNEFTKFMIDFPGYIVGFNNIYFDNPVCVMYSDSDDAYIETLNNKTIDLFLFVKNITGKKLGLNKISTALIGMQKTLESGAQGETLMQKYEQTGDITYLEEFKKYCKNDVQMTLMLFWYLRESQSLSFEEHDRSFSLEELIVLGQNTTKEDAVAPLQESRLL